MKKIFLRDIPSIIWGLSLGLWVYSIIIEYTRGQLIFPILKLILTILIVGMSARIGAMPAVSGIVTIILFSIIIYMGWMMIEELPVSIFLLNLRVQVIVVLAMCLSILLLLSSKEDSDEEE